MAADNKSLGRFILDGIPPSPRGLPQVEVTFDIDANGILNVKAKDKQSGREQSIRIEARSGLTPDEIERLKKEAEAHAAEDQEKRAAAEARNLADQLIYTAEKALTDAGDKVDAAVKTGVEEKIKALKEARQSDDAAKIKQATADLSQAMQKIGEAMNKQSTPPDKPGSADDQPKDDGGQGNVRDAETS